MRAGDENKPLTDKTAVVARTLATRPDSDPNPGHKLAMPTPWRHNRGQGCPIATLMDRGRWLA